MVSVALASQLVSAPVGTTGKENEKKTETATLRRERVAEESQKTARERE